MKSPHDQLQGFANAIAFYAHDTEVTLWDDVCVVYAWCMCGVCVCEWCVEYSSSVSGLMVVIITT